MLKSTHIEEMYRRDILRKPQIHISITPIALIQEQDPIAGRLLDHLRVHVVALRELLLVLRVLVRNHAGEVGLLVGALSRELVQREGGGEGGEGDVEAGLRSVSMRSDTVGLGGGRRTPKDSLTGAEWWESWWPEDS